MSHTLSTKHKCFMMPTSHGTLAVEQSGRGETPVLLIHGNSFCRSVFRNQLLNLPAEKYHLITFDLPGHGESSDAPDPAQTYTVAGLVGAAVEVLEKLHITRVAVVGWSLGGHIGIEMISRFPGLLGLMIIGAPPVGHSTFFQGFKPVPAVQMAAKENPSQAEIEALVHTVFGDSAEPFLCAAFSRADGRFRKRLFEAVHEHTGPDARVTVENSTVPLAVVNGAGDPIINLDYFDTIAYRNLWEGRCHRMPGLGHAPFWQEPGAFNLLLDRFLEDVST